ncbi:MAG: tRNA lysidine(34) synthetase TilS [Bacteroidales bacterium]|nr:tRNA lysidine(34) synthetase TilS [Bacteroidales bacterium]
MISRFIQSLTHLVGEPKGHRYLLAVSGGADSIVMAHLCHHLGLDFEMAHCNFHLRGEASNEDMRLVQTWASQRNIPLHIREFDTLALQEQSGLSMEMMARKLRYDWFEELGQAFDFIVTAHHANDAAETLLLNLSRGTGLKGLCAIPERNGKIIRPMLVFSAEEIRSFASMQNIDFAVDSTNSDETIKRNRIRHSVIPVLTELNPNLINTLTHDCQVLRQQYAFYQRQMASKKRTLVTQRDNAVVVDYAALRNDPDKNIILYEILKDYGFPATVADALCREVQSGKQFLSQDLVLLVHGDELIIKSPSQDAALNVECFSIEELTRYFRVEEVHADGKIQFARDNKVLYLPQRLLTWPVTIRYWQKGDFFYPLGGKGKKKLSDYFIDHKIDCFTKQQIPLFCIGKDIVWIVGHRSDNRYKITDKDTDYYKITYTI